jgi:hypothetical protein
LVVAVNIWIFKEFGFERRNQDEDQTAQDKVRRKTAEGRENETQEVHGFSCSNGRGGLEPGQ